MIILIQIPSTNNNRPSAGAGPCRPGPPPGRPCRGSRTAPPKGV